MVLDEGRETEAREKLSNIPMTATVKLGDNTARRNKKENRKRIASTGQTY